ncbi:hypothetical protein KXW37_000382, partial [Aspergillus fumigatus]
MEHKPLAPPSFRFMLTPSHNVKHAEIHRLLHPADLRLTGLTEGNSMETWEFEGYLNAGTTELAP